MSTLLYPVWSLPWNLLFASFVWRIWKQKNDITSGNMPMSDEVLLRRSLAWANHYHGCAVARESLSIAPRAVSHAWTPPDPGWVCLTVDGGVSLASGMGRIRGLIRSSEGD
ncbi:hypothetical protein V6N11_025894 [Hibiscus sabdariffa]|uniref:Uncharacterized protein n=1 Tax=Hibiscus sabdariffa TaxID=183260 RepID=A0ABR2SUY9_9ROSI